MVSGLGWTGLNVERAPSGATKPPTIPSPLPSHAPHGNSACSSVAGADAMVLGILTVGTQVLRRRRWMQREDDYDPVWRRMAMVRCRCRCSILGRSGMLDAKNRCRNWMKRELCIYTKLNSPRLSCRPRLHYIPRYCTCELASSLALCST